MIVYCPGCWDLLHAGHLNILERSRAIAREDGLLIVGVVSDAGVAAYKPSPPAEHEKVRLEAVRGLGFVDVAVLQATTDPSPMLRALSVRGCRPDILTHGDDWTELREGNETLVDMGIELRLLPYTPGVSSTLLRARMIASPSGVLHS